MKNIIIAILAAIVLVFAFLFFTQKKNAPIVEPWPETEPANPTTPKPMPPVSSTTTQTQTNTNPTQTPATPSETSSNLENTETPIYIKSIYQKNGKWWADVDYVTYDSGNYVNQNPLIRSFVFASSFKSTGVGAGCFDGGVVNTPEGYKNFLDPAQYSNAGYSYSVYQTRGLLIENAIIKNSQITEFNFPTSCVG